MNLLQMLQLHGQSIWLDRYDREMVISGQLQQYLDDEVRGIVSNFSSIERSLRASQYDRDFQAMAEQMDVPSLYKLIIVREMQLAAERFKEVHDQTDGKDGYVNLDLPPHVVSDAESMLTEARRLWRQIGWSNLMLNIPVAPETLLVIQQLIGEGINVNVTQVVSFADYKQVTEAYLAGLEAFAAQDGAIHKIASVASVPVSRLDAAILTHLKIPRSKQEWQVLEGVATSALHNFVGIAQAKMLYQQYRDFYRNGDTCSFARRWQTLAERGAHPQRLAWVVADRKTAALTQHYVESLMGSGTVMVLSPTQLAMGYEENSLRSSLTEDLETAYQTLVSRSQSGVSLDQVAQYLRFDEQARTQASFEQLLRIIEQKTSLLS